MPVVAIAVCPHPPLLVPELAGGAAAETDDLRAACATAVARLTRSAPEVVVVVGSGPRAQRYGPGTHGSFAAYGAPRVDVALGPPDGTADDELPLSVLVGAWILQEHGDAVPRSAVTVADDAKPEDCLRLGEQLAAAPERLALLVMGDGSARHSEHAPVHLHPRGEAFDAVVATALGAADLTTLAGLDAAIATEVAAAGRPAWQVMAGAAAGQAWTPELLYAEAPYGVGYFVATWSPQPIAS